MAKALPVFVFMIVGCALLVMLDGFMNINLGFSGPAIAHKALWMLFGAMIYHRSK